MAEGGTLTLDDLLADGRVELDDDAEEMSGGTLRTEPLARLCVVDDGFEADLLRGALRDEGIPCLVETYRDIALDGLFQLTRGWGALVVPLSDLERATALVDEVRPGLQDPAPTPEEDGTTGVGDD